MPVSRLHLAGAIAIVGALVLGALLWRQAAGDPQREPAAGGPVAAGEVPGSAAGASPEDLPAWRQPAQPDASAPLPALDTPLRLVVDDLRRRADAGDAAAACRLAAEFERCRSMASRANDFEPTDMLLESLLIQASDEEEIASIERHVAERERAKIAAAAAFEHCAGVPEPAVSERVRYWRRAALGGHVPAMRHYAIGNAFRFDDLMGAVPELGVYRREAEQVALRAAAAGDAEMIHALAMAYLPRGGADDWTNTGFRPFLAQVVQPDPRKALAWLYALQQHPLINALPEDHPARMLPEWELPRLVAQLPAAQVAAARAAAAGHARDWPRQSAESARLAVYRNGGLGDVAREECEPATPEWRPATAAP